MPPEDTTIIGLEEQERFWEWADRVMGLKPDFFRRLESDDDWAFLIKWQAALETCANHLLTRHFGNEKLAKVFARLDMSNSQCGKVAFIAASDLLPESHRLFIRRFSEMRNHAVHDIKNFGFTFGEYIKNYKKDERPALIKQVGFACERWAGTAGLPDIASIVETVPRAVISVACRLIVAEVFAWDECRGNPDEATRILARLAPLLALQFQPLRLVSIPTE